MTTTRLQYLLLLLLTSCMTGWLAQRRFYRIPAPAVTQPASAPAASRPATLPRGIEVITYNDTWEMKADAKTAFDHATDYIRWRETKNGTDITYRRRNGDPGPAGELGEYQITPIFQRDCLAKLALHVDPLDNTSCQDVIPRWLAYYAKAYRLNTDKATLYQLYRLGPGSSFLRWYRNQH